MKALFSAIGVVFLVSGLNATIYNYKLSEAILKNLVTLSVTGAKNDTALKVPYSSHYGPCMSMVINSSSNDALNLSLEYGYRLEPEDSNIQTMMVTQTLMVKLEPKQKKTYRVYAMCTEATDGGPSPYASFHLKKRAGGNLLSLAEFIDRKKYQDDAAQDAVWCLTNGHDLHTIFSNDTTMMYDLRWFIAKLKGLPLSSIYDEASRFVPSAPVYTVHTIYSGSINYNIIGSGKILIALFDEDNHMKTVYVNNEVQREGQYTYNYKISSEEMGDKKYYLKMFKDGKLEEDIAILP